MNGLVIGMPKFQLFRDFFWDLEGPYEIMKLNSREKEERIRWLSALLNVATFEEYKNLLKNFLKTAKVREVRRYKQDIEIVKYEVWYKVGEHEFLGPNLLDVKYKIGGELISYTFDPDERTPMEVVASLSEFDLPINRVEDILDYCWNMKYEEGLIVEEDGGHALIHAWNLSDDNTSKYTLEWCWGPYERLRMCCMVFSVNEMVEFVRRYIRSGLSEAQQGLQWRCIYGDISR